MSTKYTSIPSHSPHNSLDGFHQPHHGLPPHPQLALNNQGQTCVPSLIPPGIDPAQVDIRTFYPYQPNEVKHRKRTTRPQLKVLENVYEHDTKPNAVLRKKLADELGMTPRGVQVWFQNRRAKEKNQAKKIDASLSVTGTTTSASSSSAPAVPTADGTTTSEAESSTASASTDANSESPDTLTTPSPALGEPASASTVRTVRPSLSTLPAVPATTALDEVAYAGDLSAPTSDTDSSPSHVPQAFMTRPVRTNPSAAELLAQRRPSLPILNMHSLPHTIRRMPSGLSGKAIPKGFDPYERRKSVDTMNANMRRLASHPYASQAAQYVHSHGPGGFGHGMSMYGGPQSLHVRRSISHTGLTDLEEGSDGLSGTSFSSPERTHQTPQGRTYYLTPTSTHTHNQAQNRPMLTQRVSMPSFHPDHQHRPSPPSASANGSFAGLSFTDPWHAQSQKLQSASSAIDSPISPHALPPASPGRPAPPLPYNGLMLAQSLSRRYAVGQGRPHEHPQDFGSTMSRYNMSTRSIPAPVPGPLPDAHFSFGVPSSSAPSSNGSSSSTSPVVHDAGLSYGGGRNRAVVEEEADDASAVSSTYDPRSRFGSLASVASTESSWTSAYYSDAEGRKLSVSAPDGYDAERRGSIASGYLPQLFGELDVNGGKTPQPVRDGGVPPDQPHPAHSRRGSPNSLHEQRAFSGVYAGQEVYDPRLQHDGFTSNRQSPYNHTPPHDLPYSNEHGSYSPSSTISARSHGASDEKGIDEHSHSVSPSMPQHSHSSDLMYAFNGSETLEAQLSYPNEFDPSLASTPEHNLSPHQAHPQYSPLSPKTAHYSSHSYSHQDEPYDVTQAHSQPVYPLQEMHYLYQMHQGTEVYNTGAIDLGSMCIPASMDGMHMGNYPSS